MDKKLYDYVQAICAVFSFGMVGIDFLVNESDPSRKNLLIIMSRQLLRISKVLSQYIPLRGEWCKDKIRQDIRRMDKIITTKGHPLVPPAVISDKWWCVRTGEQSMLQK